MNVSKLNTAARREILHKLGEKLISESKDASARDVRAHVEYLAEGYLEPLSNEDFFGSEGWERWLGVE